MELGRIADIDNAQTNHVEKIQSVKEVDDKQKIVQDEQYKKVQGKVQDTESNEVILDNVRFGYNKSSKDFFVKVTRGEAEYKYPTEDMMRVKAQILSDLEKSLKES
ncbi:flagellin [Arcobacter sp. LA11]|uniref:flagellin n=1 Tax=Arcobacter sp. LA11 TaxID=1898176 RepID=UPI000934A0AF|nr:flagellin [Arcobacter sp. LA11]